MTSNDAPDHGSLRASDSDREAVVEVLRTAAGEGRLDIDELQDRLDAAWAARTYADLDAQVTDLPDVRLPWWTSRAAPRSAAVVVPGDAADTLTLNAGMSNEERSGRWTVPARLVLEPSVSTIKLDFRDADCPHDVVAVEIHGGVGSVVMIVPEGWRVDSTGLRTGWGSQKNKRDGEAEPGMPTLVVSGGIGMGSLTVRGARFYD